MKDTMPINAIIVIVMMHITDQVTKLKFTENNYTYK